MKKFFVGLGSLAGVVVGALLIWKVVVPFIGNIFSWFGSFVTGLF